MEKERRIKTLSVVALIIAVLGLTIAFAALSTTLTINGNASVDSAEWDIHFSDIETFVFNDAKVRVPPEIQEDTLHIGDFKVSLTKPGDGVKFNFKIVNNGTISAKSDQTVIFNGLNNQIAEELELYESIFEEADFNGDGQTTLEERQKAVQYIYLDYEFQNFSLGSDCYYLRPGQTGMIVLKIAFDIEATELPKGNVKLNLNMDFPFEQS